MAAPAGVPGDYNNNGLVDAADYVVWRDNVGTNNTLPNNTLPGPIGQAHYDQWRANFAKPVISGGQASAVPEPASCVLIGIAMLAILTRRR
jgi:hypothetical protein